MARKKTAPEHSHVHSHPHEHAAARPELERYTVTMPRDLFVAFDRRNEARGYRNRSEALRDLVRDALVREEWENPNQQVAATLTLVYDHHQRGLSDKINAIQHDYGGHVISTMHVHLDHDNCLEVIVMRGQAGRLRALADSLSSLKGVKHARMATTTEGRDLA